MKKLGIVVAASIFAGTVAAGPAHSSFAAGKPYGCQINPNATRCQKPAQPAVVAGVVSGVAGGAATTNSPVYVLPRTGGGADMPSGSGSTPLLPIAGSFLLLAGLAMRRITRR